MTQVRVAELRPAATLLFLAAGGLLHLLARPEAARHAWLAGLLLLGIPMVWRTLRGALAGRFAADIVASLAVLAALLLRDPLPGLVVVLMQTGGEALERRAARRATRAVEALERDAPREAHRLDAADRPETIPVGKVVPGDRLLVRPGELVPCDGVVLEGRSHVDRARVSGEPVPEAAGPGDRLLSGTRNLDGALEMRATAAAGESTYARIVELVRGAQASKAPLQRMADRYAIWFTPLTLAACAAAWALSGEASRVLAVLVVATPCPLLLAAPVAVIGGIDRGARRRIVFRHGGALEAAAVVDTAVFDKTGTLTLGQPVVDRVEPQEGFETASVLALAAAVEERSGHPLARSVVAAALDAGLPVGVADEVRESAGAGVEGRVGGQHVAVGGAAWVASHLPGAALPGPRDGLWAWVAVDGALAGGLRFADRPREEVATALDQLRQAGVREVVLLSGDRDAEAAAVGRLAGVDRSRGDMLPDDKAAEVRRLVAEGRRVLMVGDGVNDAPALSTAQVGVALASGSGGLAAESADVVLLADDLRLVPEAVRIGQDTMRIARQSIVAGLGLSGGAMVAAALGHVPPAVGALLQEGIDVAVILNALRAAR